MTPRRRERGVSTVEAAFALPVLFTLVLTFFDFGSWVLQSNQAAAAARDGARVGILHYVSADVPASSDYTAIQTAVRRRLAGQAYTSLTMTCVGPSSTTPVSGGCAAATVDTDRITVNLSWTRTAWSPIGRLFGSQTIRGTATMTINGLPQ